jgi:hypothetical protein
MLLLAPLVALTWDSESAIAKVPWDDPNPTPAVLRSGISCERGLEYCAPPPALIAYLRDRVPAEAILAVDLGQIHEPSMFVPQQVTVWSGAVEGLVDPERIFSVYFRHLARAQAAGHEQPFFNAGETAVERQAFLQDLGVTHVLLNPRMYQSLKPVFDQERDLLTVRLDAEQWALYEVHQ